MANANALNIQLNGETGTGQFVGDTSPTINTASLVSPSLTTPSLGTPTSGTLTNCTGLPVVTGISGLGTGVASWLSIPSSANLQACVTGETGSGALVFGTAPTLGSPSMTSASTDTINVTSAAGVTINSKKPVVTVKQQIFTTSGTYTPSTGMLYCLVEVQGAGGGSGGNAATAGNGAVAGGGGSGGYSRSLLDAATIGASQTVTIAAGGAGGAAGANPGSNATATSLGTLVIANGGSGGGAGAAVGNNTLSSTGGTAAAVGTGQYAIPGNNGQAGLVISTGIVIGACGGSSYFSGTNFPTTTNNAAVAGLANTGQGALSPGSIGSQAAKAGAAGGSGLIIITEFCNQ